MRTVRDTDPKSPRDPKQDFITRAKGLTGKPLQGFENLEGLDYERLQGMSDDEMRSLLDFVQKLSPEEKGDVSGGISKAFENLGEIKDVIGGLRDNYGLDTKKLLNSILEERGTGYLKSGLIKGAAKTAGLYRDGGSFRILKK